MQQLATIVEEVVLSYTAVALHTFQNQNSFFNDTLAKVATYFSQFDPLLLRRVHSSRVMGAGVEDNDRVLRCRAEILGEAL